jgi:hypothetical protein
MKEQENARMNRLTCLLTTLVCALLMSVVSAQDAPPGQQEDSGGPAPETGPRRTGPGGQVSKDRVSTGRVSVEQAPAGVRWSLGPDSVFDAGFPPSDAGCRQGGKLRRKSRRRGSLRKLDKDGAANCRKGNRLAACGQGTVDRTWDSRPWTVQVVSVAVLAAIRR